MLLQVAALIRTLTETLLINRSPRIFCFAHYLNNCLSHSAFCAPPPRKSLSGWSYGVACSGCCEPQSASPPRPTPCPTRSCPATSSCCPSARRGCNNPKTLQSFFLGEESTTWRVKTVEDEDDDQDHVDSSHLIYMIYMYVRLCQRVTPWPVSVCEAFATLRTLCCILVELLPLILDTTWVTNRGKFLVRNFWW